MNHSARRPRATKPKKKNIGLYRTSTILSTVSRSVAQTSATAKTLAQVPNIPHVWLLVGTLGAGKTTFVRGALRSLGVRRVVTSPTFTLSRHYALRRAPWRRVVHIDAYRLRSVHEQSALELESLLHDPTVLVLIEWPERLRDARWPRHLLVTLDHRREGRKIVACLR